MTSFKEARAFLLAHRTDYDAAVSGFRWPDPVPFNWALDWFDAELARDPAFRDLPALWIVESGQDRHTKLSFETLSRRSNQVANFLRAQGLQRGDHLLLLLGNVVPLWETMLAAMKLGLVVIPATTLLTPDELGDRLERGKARAVVAARDQVGKFADLAADRLVRIVVGGSAQGWRAYDEAAEAPETFAPDGLTQADDPMLLYFTSGTTARPKLVRHSHRSYPVGHLSTMYWLGLQPGDIHLNISSPGWAKHAWSCFFAPWNAGATVCDVVFQDEEGYLTFVGRSDDVFKSSDYRISPFELESVLLEHEAVAEAAVVPSPDPIRLAVPKAFVLLSSNAPRSRETALSVFKHLHHRLSPFKRIRRIEIVSELPKTISGKIRRVQLRRLERDNNRDDPFRGQEFREEDFPELQKTKSES